MIPLSVTLGMFARASPGPGGLLFLFLEDGSIQG